MDEDRATRGPGARPRLTHLNGDTSWLLSIPSPSSSSSPPFKLIIDPWLSGSQTDYFPSFSRQSHVVVPAFPSISAVEETLGKVDAIILSHEFTDHTHEETLGGARKDTSVFGHPRAKQRVDKWSIFDLPAGSTPVAGPTYDWSEGHSEDDGKARLPGKTLHRLGEEAGWPTNILSRMPDYISLLYVPTDDRFDPAGDRLHGLTVISFLSPSSSSACSVSSVVYSPHGLPRSSITALATAFPPSPRHRYLALIHHFDRIVLPFLGVVNAGPRTSGIEIVKALRPQRWIRTHDELKKAEGAVGRMLKRQRGSKESVSEMLKETGVDDVEVVELESGESLDL